MIFSRFGTKQRQMPAVQVLMKLHHVCSDDEQE